MIPMVLDTMSVYARFHFQREERVMEAIAFSEASVHRREHQDFTRWIDRLRRRFEEGADAAAAVRLWEDLAVWLRHHILIQDMAFKPLIVDAAEADRIARAGTADCLLDLGDDMRLPRHWQTPPLEALALPV